MGRSCWPGVTWEGVTAIATHLTALNYLDLNGCQHLSNESVASIAAHLKALQYLDVGLCDISDLGVEQLAVHRTPLHHLDLTNCDVSSAAIRWLASRTSVKHLPQGEQQTRAHGNSSCDAPGVHTPLKLSYPPAAWVWSDVDP